MKTLILAAAIMSALGLASTGASADGSVQYFGQSVQHVGQSAKHTGGSLGTSIIGSSKLVSGVAALPFKSIGKAGAASEALGDYLWGNATGAEKLEVSEETVTAGPAPMIAVNN